MVSNAPESDLPPTVVDDILDSERRRLLLTVLAERESPIPLVDLASAICAKREGDRQSSISNRRRRSVREQVFETDLPKLTATGVVKYDSVLGTVELAYPAIAEAAARQIVDS